MHEFNFIKREANDHFHCLLDDVKFGKGCNDLSMNERKICKDP